MTTKLGIEALAHEIPIYEEAHPEGTVQLLSKGEVIEMDAGEEFEELMHKFGQHEESGVPLAEHIYGRGGHQLENNDFSIKSDVIAADEIAPEFEADTPDLSLDDMREYLSKLGVEYKSRMNGGTLKALIETATGEMVKKLEDLGLYIPDDPLAMKAILDSVDDKAA